MKLPFPRPLFAALAVALALSGCTLPQYQRSAGKPSAPTALNLHGEDASLSADLATVIVYGGPGSWKREAWWDEYVVALTSHSVAPVTVIALELEDFSGQRSPAAIDPWKLERESQRWWEHASVRGASYVLALGAGAATVAAVAYGSVLFGTTSLGTAAAVTTTAVVAVPVVAVGALLTNVHHRDQIEQEFNRRRLPLPAALANGGTVSGSCFFRVSPGPRHLFIRYRQGTEEHELAVPLTPLSGLHFQRRDYSLDTPPPPDAK